MTQPLTLSARCAATLFIVGFLMATITDAAEIRLRDGVHRVSKAPPQVTPGPVLHRREAVTVCAAGYNLCPINLGGGCCQDGYSCATESCFATTAGPVSCNGRSGYFACGVDVGGGCCPLGSVCERGGQCVPVPGVSYSHECSANSYLCPADLGYGCCQNGLACGKSQCYATEPQTYVFTKTATTTEDGGAAKTLTSTITTTVTPTGDSEPTGAFPPETQFAKYYPSAIDKEQPIVTNTEDKDDGGGGGLTGAQIGGAVGGAVALLAIILVAAFLVIRRLNHVAKVVQEGGASVSGGSGSTADTSDYFKKGAGETEVESLNTDMLSVSSPRTRHRSASSTTSEPGSLFGLRSAGGGSSGFSSRRQSHRSNSESTAAGSSTPGTWTRSNSTSVSRSGSSGRRTSGFGDATGVSSDNEGEEIAELEAGERAVELPAEPVAASPGGSAGVSGGGAGGGSGGRGDGLAPPPQPGHRRSSSAAVRGAPQLDMVSEAGEFHGYYGPADKLMGQTAARQVAAADKAARPVSSPPAMAGASDPAPGADGREES